jgi:3-oxoacyl-[acyl-carrier protein] reductase
MSGSETTLAGKKALVCGASQGIGRACAVELARLGANVTVVARDEEALAQVVAELNAAGAPARHDYLVADFDAPPVLEERVAKLVALNEAFHILVNNSGGPASGPLTEATPDALMEGFSRHVSCFQRLVQALVPGMKQAGYGRIVNIISTSVLQPIRGLGVSNTVRGAVANWGRTLAGELAPFGITVNNILPGYTDTGRLRSLIHKWAQRDGVSYEDALAQSLKAIPMGRLAEPVEIAAVVGFLASPRASYLTGVNLPVDGGRTAVQ